MALINCLILFIFYNAVQGQEPSAATPFVVSVQEGKDHRHYCSGTILNKEWVLTSADCLIGYYGNLRSAKNIRIATGPNNNKPLSVHSVEKMISHEEYSRRRPYPNDIALFKVTPPFEFNEHVSSAKLPKPNMEVAKGTTAIAAGYGPLEGSAKDSEKDGVVKQRTVGIHEHVQCQLQYMFYFVVTDKQICTKASSKEHVRGNCLTDHGGPLTIQDTIVGINSYPGDCGYLPDLYTRVSEYLDWIQENMA